MADLGHTFHQLLPKSLGVRCLEFPFQLHHLLHSVVLCQGVMPCNGLEENPPGNIALPRQVRGSEDIESVVR